MTARAATRVPIWQQLVDRKEEWIGGDIEDFGDSFDRRFCDEGTFPIRGKISDMEFRKNPTCDEEKYPPGMWFGVSAVEGFSCGGDTEHVGITGGEEGWLTFSGYGGHTWRIRRPADKVGA